MRTLYAVRHAKSSWAHAGMGDHERPLNERGLQTGPEMAARLKRRGVVLDRLIVSSAKRAQETAAFFAEALELSRESVVTETSLYGADVGDWIQLIGQLDEAWSNVMVIGHNPTLTEFANALGRMDIANVPTCGILACDYAGEYWANFADDARKIKVRFDFPKNSVDEFV